MEFDLMFVIQTLSILLALLFTGVTVFEVPNGLSLLQALKKIRVRG